MGGSLNLLIEIAKEIFSSVHPMLGKPRAGEIVGLGFGGDKTRLIDEVAEKAAVNYLERNGVSCVFIGEECGVKRIGSLPEFYLIVDGVDGTNNAVRGVKFASSSIAMSSTGKLGDLEAAVVIDLYDGGIFSAERGMGAKYNDRKIKPSNSRSLGDAIVSVDVSRSAESIERTTPIMGKVKGLRAFGSASLEICYVASGLLDAYIDLRGMLRTIDFAAGMLIILEAGGVFLQPTG
ncbi:MAG: D-fructose 1,6-bisphosphatase, partial [Candidatus Bathyarchaeota archaeon]|nr:D-fructose 1,6-bisphosphatase [Candidatus Bathyarchaeota archaeon]